MIKIKFFVKELTEQISIIQDFLKRKNNLSNYIAKCFDIDINLPKQKRDKEIKEKITKLYYEKFEEMKNSCAKFQSAWDNSATFINEELINIFGKEFFFECKGFINLNPIFPRYLETKSFDIHTDCDDEEMLFSSTHEIIHFVWFEIWKENFPNTLPIECEFPNLIWFISELAIEPIFRFSNLKELSSCNPAYDYFYTDKLGNKTLAETANEIFASSKNINDFQIKIYNAFKDNEEIYKLIK